MPCTYLIRSVTIHLKYRDGLPLKRASLWPACGRPRQFGALPGLASGLALAVRPLRVEGPTRTMRGVPSLVLVTFVRRLAHLAL